MQRRGKIRTEILQFDVIAYLQDRNIPISYQSRHTSEGYVNIQCPFCHDGSDHLGINITTKIANCWLCGGKNITKIVAMLEGGCSYAQANTIIREYGNIAFGFTLENSVRRHVVNVIPKYALGADRLNEWPTAHLKYLESRRFEPETVIAQYDLCAVAQAPKYSWRILIPIRQGHNIVSFSAMDISGKHALKYVACSNNEGLIPIKDTVYNIDTVQDTMLIVEGYTDVWRIGAGAVAVMGMQFTLPQLQIIAYKGARRAFVLFDGEDLNDPDFITKHRKTLAQAKKLAMNLKGIVPMVEVLEMSHNDPGDLTPEEVAELRGIVFGH